MLLKILLYMNIKKLLTKPSQKKWMLPGGNQLFNGLVESEHFFSQEIVQSHFITPEFIPLSSSSPSG